MDAFASYILLSILHLGSLGLSLVIISPLTTIPTVFLTGINWPLLHVLKPSPSFYPQQQNALIF